PGACRRSTLRTWSTAAAPPCPPIGKTCCGKPGLPRSWSWCSLRFIKDGYTNIPSKIFLLCILGVHGFIDRAYIAVHFRAFLYKHPGWEGGLPFWGTCAIAFSQCRDGFRAGRPGD